MSAPLTATHGPLHLTNAKTADIASRGYNIVGYVLRRADGDEVCVSAESAVRWLPQDHYARLMHEQDGSLFAAPAAAQTLPELCDLFGAALDSAKPITLTAAAAGVLYFAMKTGYPLAHAMKEAPAPAPADERIAELEAENDRLRAALGDEVRAATLLRELSLKDGGLNMTLEGGACRLLAEAFHDQFDQAGAANYIEVGFNGRDGRRLLVTVQRVDGKTPAQFRAEAEAKAAALEIELAKSQRVRWMVGQALHNVMVGNQAAWIEWQNGAGAEEAMTWIHNGLVGPGMIPSAEEGTTAQGFFDAHCDNRMEPDEPRALPAPTPVKVEG